jgi:hypothetical protein
MYGPDFLAVIVEKNTRDWFFIYFFMYIMFWLYLKNSLLYCAYSWAVLEDCFIDSGLNMSYIINSWAVFMRVNEKNKRSILHEETDFHNFSYILCCDCILSMSCRQIFWWVSEKHNYVRSISRKIRRGLNWFSLSQRIIALRSVSLYYIVENLVAPYELWTTTYIVKITAL